MLLENSDEDGDDIMVSSTQLTMKASKWVYDVVE
jgi:hypothetical protein